VDRRTFVQGCFPAVLAHSAIGCNARIKRYDRQPKRGLLEDRWPGYYFHTVNANYLLKLQNPDTSLSRTTGVTIPIVSNNPNAAEVVFEQPSIRPTSVTVDIEYVVESDEEQKQEIRVGMEWPRTDNSFTNDRSTITEVKSATFGFESVRRFLEGTGRFRVDRTEHFYGTTLDPQRDSDHEHPINVTLLIEGPNSDARFSTTMPYHDRSLLFKLAQRLWPGIA